MCVCVCVMRQTCAVAHCSCGLAASDGAAADCGECSEQEAATDYVYWECAEWQQAAGQ